MARPNDATRYSLVAIILHWTTALCVIGLLTAGYIMVEYRDDLGIALTFQVYQLHKSFGVLVFVLTIARLVWRLTHPAPPLPDNMAGWEKALAKVSHYGFYALLLIMPLTGWAVVSAASFKIPTMIFGFIHLPHIPYFVGHADPKGIEALTQTVHWYMAVTMVTLLALHVGGALKHHLVLKDEVLRRMLPFGRG